MELENVLLDKANEEILNKLDNTIGLSKNKNVLREIIRYHEVMQNYKCKVEFENYNTVIRNKSSYNLYEELISVISEIYYKNNITKQPNVKYLKKEDLRCTSLKKEDDKSIEEGIIVIDLTISRKEINEIRKNVEDLIKSMPDKAFLIIVKLVKIIM